jgi:hypothetical protein
METADTKRIPGDREGPELGARAGDGEQEGSPAEASPHKPAFP